MTQSCLQINFWDLGFRAQFEQPPGVAALDGSISRGDRLVAVSPVSTSVACQLWARSRLHFPCFLEPQRVSPLFSYSFLSTLTVSWLSPFPRRVFHSNTPSCSELEIPLQKLCRRLQDSTGGGGLFRLDTSFLGGTGGASQGRVSRVNFCLVFNLTVSWL